MLPASIVRDVLEDHQLAGPDGTISLALIYVPASPFKVPAQDDGTYPEPANPKKPRLSFRKGDVYIRKGDESVKVETPAVLWPGTAPVDHAAASTLVEAYVRRFAEALTHELPSHLAKQCYRRSLRSELDSDPFGTKGLPCSWIERAWKEYSLKAFLPVRAETPRTSLLAYCKHYRGGSLFGLLDHEAKRSRLWEPTLCFRQRKYSAVRLC